MVDIQYLVVGTEYQWKREIIDRYGCPSGVYVTETGKYTGRQNTEGMPVFMQHIPGVGEGYIAAPIEAVMAIV